MSKSSTQRVHEFRERRKRLGLVRVLLDEWVHASDEKPVNERINAVRRYIDRLAKKRSGSAREG